MGQLLLFIVVALVVATIVFGVTVMMGGGDSALTPVEPDGAALPLPSDRPLGEEDVIRTRFDTALRGYRMSQVDQALQRAAYDIGYKGELIGVLEAEVAALREGRTGDADVLRRAREAAVAPPADAPADAETDAEKPIEIDLDVPPDKPVTVEPTPALTGLSPKNPATSISATSISAMNSASTDSSATNNSGSKDPIAEGAAPSQPGTRSADGEPVERR
jgi:DivIVA domain-containing protein